MVYAYSNDDAAVNGYDGDGDHIQAVPAHVDASGFAAYVFDDVDATLTVVGDA